MIIEEDGQHYDLDKREDTLNWAIHASKKSITRLEKIINSEKASKTARKQATSLKKKFQRDIISYEEAMTNPSAMKKIPSLWE